MILSLVSPPTLIQNAALSLVLKICCHEAVPERCHRKQGEGFHPERTPLDRHFQLLSPLPSPPYIPCFTQEKKFLSQLHIVLLTSLQALPPSFTTQFLPRVFQVPGLPLLQGRSTVLFPLQRPSVPTGVLLAPECLLGCQLLKKFTGLLHSVFSLRDNSHTVDGELPRSRIS